VFFHSASFADGRGLSIHIRTAEREGTSFITNAVVLIGDDRLEIQNDGTFYWNNDQIVDLALHSIKFGDGIMTHSTIDGYLPIWDIHTPRGGQIYLQVFDTMVDVKLFNFLHEDVQDGVGLLGDFNTGFLMDRSANMVFDTDEYGLAMQVQPDIDGDLFREEREPRFPAKCSAPDPDAVQRRLEQAWFSLEDAKEICEGTEELLEACIMDLRSFGNRDVARAYMHMHKMQMAKEELRRLNSSQSEPSAPDSQVTETEPRAEPQQDAEGEGETHTEESLPSEQESPVEASEFAETQDVEESERQQTVQDTQEDEQQQLNQVVEEPQSEAEGNKSETHEKGGDEQQEAEAREVE